MDKLKEFTVNNWPSKFSVKHVMSNVSPIKKIIHYLTDRHRYTINELGKSFKTVVLGMIKTGNARRYLIRIGVW